MSLKKKLLEIKYLWEFYTGQKKKYFFMIILTYLGMAFQLSVPLFYSQIISGIIDKNIKKIFISFSIIFINSITARILTYFTNILSLKISKQVNLNVKKECIKEILETDIYFEEQEDQGKLFNILMSDTLAVTAYISYFTRIVNTIITIVLIVAIIFIINWKIAVVTCLFYPFEYWVSHIYNRKIKVAAENLFEKTDKLYCFVKNIITNIRDIKNQSGEALIENKMIYLADQGRKATVQQEQIKLQQKNFVSLIRLLEYFVYMLVGIILLLQEKISLGIFTSFSVYTKNLSQYINTLIDMMANIQSTKVSVERLIKVHTRYIQSIENEKERKFLKDIQEIEFDNISVQFGKKEILKNVKCRFQKGKIYGIYGKNGVGKTSIANLLMRNIRLSKGIIRYNGVEADKVSQKWIRKQITYIGAAKIVYNMSLLDNIRMSEQASLLDEQILEVCNLVSLDEFIKNNKLLIDEDIKDNCNLSSGQMQKIQLARMIVKGGQVFIFDEALSNLDIDVKRKMYQFIQNECRNKIIIIISHNLEDYKICSDFYTLENKELFVSNIEKWSEKKIC